MEVQEFDIRFKVDNKFAAASCQRFSVGNDKIIRVAVGDEKPTVYIYYEVKHPDTNKPALFAHANRKREDNWTAAIANRLKKTLY